MTLRRMGVLFLLLSSLASWAQLGLDEAACVRQWGQPTGKQDGTLRFTSDTMSIEIAMADGAALRAVYTKPSLSDAEIWRLLHLNSQGEEWHEWQAMRRDTTGVLVARWIRADEGAMASLKGDVLTIRGAATAPEAAPPPTSGVTRAADAVPAPPDISGYWQNARSVLHVRTDGTMSWYDLGDRERLEFRMVWGHEETDAPAVFAVRDPPAQEKQGARLAMLVGQASGGLLFRTDPAAVKPFPFAAQLDNRQSLGFKRIGGMPSWKPKSPSDRPAVGDSRERAIELLGEPGGTMILGGREALVYPWGNVWIKNGVVAGVE